MHFLHLELEKNWELASVVNGLSESTASKKAKIGIILDLNPFWFQASRLSDAGLEPYFHPLRPFSWWSAHPLSVIRIDSGDRLPRLDREFPVVDEMTEFLFGKSVPNKLQPFLLRIIAHPDTDPKSRDELVLIARETQIPTLVETHGIPQLISAPGSRLVSPTGIQGTLGGYLRDQRGGTVFAVTCGHVISGAAMSQNGQQIGTATHRVGPVPLPYGTLCHAGCGSVTELDVALIDTIVTPCNQASSIVNIIGNGQIVEMKGATSGTHTYEVGGAVVEYEIGGACWKKLIQFHAPLAGILPASAQVALTQLPKSGDSGAWIIRNNTEWAGMVVASNSLCGFALSASHLVQQANAQFGTDLTLA